MTNLPKRSGIALFLFLIVLSSDGFVLNPRQCVNSSHNRCVLFSSVDDDVVSTSSTTQSPAPLATVDDWSAYLDESKGLLYYFNRRTGKSQWEPPANVVFPEISMSIDKKMEMRAQLKSYLKKRLNDSSKDTNIIDDMEKDRKRIEQKRKEAAEKLSAKMSKLEAMKMQQQQQQQKQQLQVINNVAAESSSSVASASEEPTQQANEIDDAKPTTLPIVQQGEWSAYFDIKSGLVFYYNEETKVSLWDPPAKDFPRVIMENNTPKVLDPRTSNISMERALTMTMEEDEAKRKWEEAKQREKERKARLRAEKAASENAKEEQRLAAQNQAAEQKRRSEEALKRTIEEEEREKAAATEKIAAEQQRLENERIAREEAAAAAEEEKRQKEEAEERAKVQARYEAAKAAELRRLEQERIERERKLAEAQVLLDKERLEKERAAAAAKKKKEEEDRKAAEQVAAQTATVETTVKQPTRPKEEPAFTVDDVENMVAPLKSTETISLYDILQCPPSATRSELKRAYLTLAKETHPDALLQAGVQNDEIVPDKFVEISQAWKVLGDTKLRRRYDREMRAKGVSTKAGSIFENWVMGAAKKMDEALSKAENTLDKKTEQ